MGTHDWTEQSFIPIERLIERAAIAVGIGSRTRPGKAGEARGGGDMLLRKGSLITAAAIALAFAAAASPISVGAQAASHAVTGGGSIQRGVIDIGGSPGVPAVNPRTDTLYVPLQCPTAYCTTNNLSHEMDLVDTAACNAVGISGCPVVAIARVGGDPLAAAVDETTDTIYTANATGTVSVVDGATCNATVTSGCGTPLATIHTGGFPVDDAFNPRTRTLYVVSPAGDVFVIDGARCNALTIVGCGEPVKTIADGAGPQAVDVDLATDTIYTANNGNGSGDTVSVIDGATCNGHDGGGCGIAPHTVTLAGGVFWDGVDQATDTVYVANDETGTVSVIDGARCNAKVFSGCAGPHAVATTGAGAGGVAVDASLHTAFVINTQDDTLSAINTRTCNGTDVSGCSGAILSAQAGTNHGPEYTGFPGGGGMALLPQSDTAYLVNVGGENRVSVITLGTCNAQTASGCRAPAPAAPNPEREATIDPSTDTIYASNHNLPEIDVLNGATCNAEDQSGCAPLAEIPMGYRSASLGTLDPSTHTLYAADDSGKLSAINIATCNAGHTEGCSTPPTTMAIGPYPGAPELDAATHTVYVIYGFEGARIAVVNAATCDAEVTSGCGQKPGIIKVGENTNYLAVSAKTDTIYAASTNYGKVFVINGATCDGNDHSGCGRIEAKVNVGYQPVGVAVDDATNSVYVAINNDGDSPGEVSLINGATCNGTDPAGCGGAKPLIAVGRSPIEVVIDVATDTVYVSDFSSADVSIINGSTCNAENASGCHVPAPEQATGSWPWGIAVNDDTNTVYSMNIWTPGSLSIFHGRA
jgi:DNA-binding beta-propeller fold protein YncE